MAATNKKANNTENELMQRIRTDFVEKLQGIYNVSPDEASDKQVYQMLSDVIVGILKKKRQTFINRTHSAGGKQIYYLSNQDLNFFSPYDSKRPVNCRNQY